MSRDNPFPASAVAEHESRILFNYPTAAQAQLRQGVAEFINGFAAPTENQRGRAIGVRGSLGSGKTHAVIQAENFFREKLPSGKSIYAARLPSTGMLAMYRNFLAPGLGLQDLQNVYSHHMLTLLRQSLRQSPSSGSLTQTIVDEAEARLKTGDQQYILHLAQAELLPSAALKVMIETEIGGLPKVRDDLQMAYSKLIDSKYDEVAIRWFRAEVLSSTEMADLGVTRSIDSEADAGFVLSFLLRAFRIARVALMFSMDEFESFAVRGDNDSRRNAPMFLKNLAELFIGTGHLLIVSGTNAAWNGLPKDVSARISQSIEMRLDPKTGEPEELLRVWENGPTSFVGAALTELFELAGYNVRQIIEIAHHAWRIHGESQERIPVGEVRAAAREALADAKRQGEAASQIAEAAKRNALAVTRDQPPYDFVLGEPASPAAFVKISKSVFKDDEAENTRQILEARRETMRRYAYAKTCTVILGYSREDLRAALRNSGDSVIVYDEDTFPTDFDAFLQAARNPAVVPRESDESYTVRIQKFEELAAQSRQEIDDLKKRLAEVQSAKQEQQNKAIASDAVSKIRQTLDNIADRLEREDRTIREFQESGNPFNINRILDEQRDLIGYAVFLSRVSPELPDIKSLLRDYQHSIEEAQAAASQLSKPLAALDRSRYFDELKARYEDQLSIMRELRAIDLTSPVSVSIWSRQNVETLITILVTADLLVFFGRMLWVWGSADPKSEFWAFVTRFLQTNITWFLIGVLGPLLALMVYRLAGVLFPNSILFRQGRRD